MALIKAPSFTVTLTEGAAFILDNIGSDPSELFPPTQSSSRCEKTGNDNFGMCYPSLATLCLLFEGYKYKKQWIWLNKGDSA